VSSRRAKRHKAVEQPPRGAIRHPRAGRGGRGRNGVVGKQQIDDAAGAARAQNRRDSEKLLGAPRQIDGERMRLDQSDGRFLWQSSRRRPVLVYASMTGRRGHRVDDAARQPHSEHGTQIFTLAVNAHATVVQLRQVAHKRQADTQTALRTNACLSALRE
jgi:hypothetical protein